MKLHEQSVPSTLLPDTPPVQESQTAVPTPPSGQTEPSESQAASNLAHLQARVAAARILVPINNWEFAERVWVGLRPHLRTRLWLLDTLQARGVIAPNGTVDDIHVDQLVAEIHRVETEVEELLRTRTSLSEFSALLSERLAPCLGQLENLQQALHERHVA